MKYIDAEKLEKSVTRLIASARRNDWPIAEDYLRRVIDIITSLQQEQPEMDFEEKWEKFEDWVESYNQSDYPTCYEPKQIARHFYELGLKAKKER